MELEDWKIDISSLQLWYWWVTQTHQLCKCFLVPVREGVRIVK